jgi:hypothetical protein
MVSQHQRGTGSGGEGLAQPDAGLVERIGNGTLTTRAGW